MSDQGRHFSQPKHVLDDMTCFGCGYNLRTLAVSGDCPECGHPIALTLAQYTGLPDPAWLRRVRWGVDLILASVVLFVLVYMAILNIHSWLYPLVEWIVLACFPILLLYGLWLVTSPDPKVPIDDRPRRALWTARIVIFLLAAGWLSLCIYRLNPLGLLRIEAYMLMRAALFLIGGVGMFALGFCLRAVCRRISMKPKEMRLVLHSKILGALLLLCGLLLLLNNVTHIDLPAALLATCLLAILGIGALLMMAMIRLRVELTLAG